MPEQELLGVDERPLHVFPGLALVFRLGLPHVLQREVHFALGRQARDRGQVQFAQHVELGQLRDGYPALAKWIARDPDNETLIFRRFDRLAARNILHLQAQLIALEKQSWVAWQKKDGAFWQRHLSADHVEEALGLSRQAVRISIARLIKENSGSTVNQYRGFFDGNVRILHRARMRRSPGVGVVPSAINATITPSSRNFPDTKLASVVIRRSSIRRAVLSALSATRPKA